MMKRFLKNIIIFVVPFVLILSLKKGITPYYLGNNTFAGKLSFFKENQNDINCVFFGSSRIYRHINPRIVDSILIDKNIHSYNFATTATFNPESYHIYENFIRDLPKGQINYSVLEIQLLTISERNLFTTKATYWQSFKNFSYSISYILDSEQTESEKNATIVRSIKGFMYSFFDFRLLKNFFYSEEPRGSRGFYSLDQELAELNTKAVRLRKEEFFGDTTTLKNRIEAAKIENLKEKGKLNRAHYEKLNNLIMFSKEKGIHLFFILPPRLHQTKYSKLTPILDELPEENVILLHEFEKYKSLYSMDNSFDVGHLNSKGANLFSLNLAIILNEKISSTRMQNIESK